ncbi:hypothetical protein TpMuguga_03g02675 [Theileria parva strain Muguga]|uniref:uncharacterized protein n=1 Tax=Theileria parva strain Muguga TaxID=333668 RepID=UPI001C61D9C9|nr:uncharacterized protein TpMuguga_03g02675 [Theileria parva strain Muguga]KAF5153084.1 hypothetical protein TpMuguga_03g02675 [Theileria parva strain Muguga]
MYILPLIIYVSLIVCDKNETEKDSSQIHLNIEFPKDDESKLNLSTGGSEQDKEVKTPVVIISPKPLVDYERLYKKMMELKPNTTGNNRLENEVIYDEKVASNDPVYKREMLYKLLKDVESRIAFYRADANEVEMLMSSNHGLS